VTAVEGSVRRLDASRARGGTRDRFGAWVAAAPIVAPLCFFLALVLYRILLDPTWVGDLSDDGGYFTMSRNIWHYGLPTLDDTGSSYWSHSLSPGLSIVLAPLGALPLGAAVLTERLAVMLSGAAFLWLSYVWLRRDVGLDAFWSSVVLVCTGASYALVEHSAAIMSDVPAAAALMAGIVLVRRDRPVAGVAAFALAAALRPIGIAVLVAVLGWLVFSGQLAHRPAARRALAWLLAAGVVVGVVVVGIGGFTQYGHQFLHPANGIGDTIVHQAKELSWYPLFWILKGTGAVDAAHLPLKLCSLGLLVVAAIGARRQRLGLESVVVLSTAAVLLCYRAPAVSEGRYVIPLAPLVLGAAATVVARRRWSWIVAAVAVAVAVGSNLNWYATHTPWPSARTIAARRQVYRWIDRHLPPSSRLLTTDDPPVFQTHLYTGLPVDQTQRGAVEGRTYVVLRAGAGAPHNYLTETFATRTVYRNALYAVVRLDRRDFSPREAPPPPTPAG
jgi:hypothetical protein